MNSLDIVDHHIIIRDTVGYKGIEDVPIEDLPQVMDFLKVVYNYQRMDKVKNKK